MDERRLTARGHLQEHGYCRFRVPHDTRGADDHAALLRLQAAVADLPADPYASSANRYRQYSPAVLLPWQREIDWAPNRHAEDAPYTEYFQGVYNPEYRDVFRRFSPVADALKAEPLLHRILWHDFDLTFWTERELTRPFVVGVHLVKLLVAEPGEKAVSSPDHLHQDGEPFTFVHLLVRDNAVGAENVIAGPEVAGSRPEDVAADAIVDEFSLCEPLESFGVHDQAVTHYVTALRRGPEDRPAVRAALLVDFAPLVPAF